MKFKDVLHEASRNKHDTCQVTNEKSKQNGSSTNIADSPPSEQVGSVAARQIRSNSYCGSSRQNYVCSVGVDNIKGFEPTTSQQPDVKLGVTHCGVVPPHGDLLTNDRRTQLDPVPSSPTGLIASGLDLGKTDREITSSKGPMLRPSVPSVLTQLSSKVQFDLIKHIISDQQKFFTENNPTGIDQDLKSMEPRIKLESRDLTFITAPAALSASNTCQVTHSATPSNDYNNFTRSYMLTQAAKILGQQNNPPDGSFGVNGALNVLQPVNAVSQPDEDAFDGLLKLSDSDNAAMRDDTFGGLFMLSGDEFNLEDQSNCQSVQQNCTCGDSTTDFEMFTVGHRPNNRQPEDAMFDLPTLVVSLTSDGSQSAVNVMEQADLNSFPSSTEMEDSLTILLSDDSQMSNADTMDANSMAALSNELTAEDLLQFLKSTTVRT